MLSRLGRQIYALYSITLFILVVSQAFLPRQPGFLSLRFAFGSFFLRIFPFLTRNVFKKYRAIQKAEIAGQSYAKVMFQVVSMHWQTEAVINWRAGGWDDCQAKSRKMLSPSELSHGL